MPFKLYRTDLNRKTSHSLSLTLVKLTLIFNITKEIQYFTWWLATSYLKQNILLLVVYLNHCKILNFKSFKLPDHWFRETAAKTFPKYLNWYTERSIYSRLKYTGPYPSLPHFIQHIKVIFVAELSQTADVKITLGHWHLRNWIAFKRYKRPFPGLISKRSYFKWLTQCYKDTERRQCVTKLSTTAHHHMP